MRTSDFKLSGSSQGPQSSAKTLVRAMRIENQSRNNVESAGMKQQNPLVKNLHINQISAKNLEGMLDQALR